MTNHLAVIRAVAAAATLGAVSAAPVAAQFEGTITMRISSTRGGGDMRYSIKGDRLRIDLDAATGGMYIIADSGLAKMVMPAQRIYLEPPMPKVSDQAAAKAKQTSMKATGRKETIAGYQCEHYLITAEDGQYDACFSKQLGKFMAPMNPMMGSAKRGDVLGELGDSGFPLKVQKVKGETALEVTRIEKKVLSEDMFRIPAGYQRMDLGAMMKGRP
jgi:hypothetical protein